MPVNADMKADGLTDRLGVRPAHFAALGLIAVAAIATLTSSGRGLTEAQYGLAIAAAVFVAASRPRRPRHVPEAAFLAVAALIGLSPVWMTPFTVTTGLWLAGRVRSGGLGWLTAVSAVGAAVALDTLRGHPEVFAPSLVGLVLLTASHQRPAAGQSPVSAGFAALLLLQAITLTGPPQRSTILAAATVAAGALFVLAGGRAIRHAEAARREVAWAIAGGLWIAAAAAEMVDSARTFTTLAAVFGTTLAADALDHSDRADTASGWVQRLAAVSLIPAFPIGLGAVWHVAVAGLLGGTVDSPLTGIPQPDGAAGLLATLIWFGPLLSTPLLIAIAVKRRGTRRPTSD